MPSEAIFLYKLQINQISQKVIFMKIVFIGPSSSPTTPQTGSEIHWQPRLQTHTICMGENVLNHQRNFRPLEDHYNVEITSPFFCTWVSTHLNDLQTKFEVNRSSFTALYPSLFDGCGRSQDPQGLSHRLAGNYRMRPTDSSGSGRCWFYSNKDVQMLITWDMNEKSLVTLSRKWRWIIEMKIAKLLVLDT